MENQTLPDSHWVKWRHYSVSQGILVINHKVLLVANDYGGPKPIWSLPGGRLEPGEQQETALRREFKEETGLEVVSEGLVFVVDSRTERDYQQFLVCVFAVKLAAGVSVAANGEPEISCKDDAAVKQVKFVPFPEIPQYIERPSLGQPLINYLYYGNDCLPSRYWCYPEYNSPDFVPNRWPPHQ